MEPCEEDYTSMAARSLLTLNTSTSKGTQEKTSKDTQDKNTLPERPSQNAQIYITSQNVSQSVRENVIAVRIDRSDGNPNVQIMKSGQKVTEPSNKPQPNVEIMELGQEVAEPSNKPQPNLQIMKSDQEVAGRSNRHKQQVIPSTEEGLSKPKMKIVDSSEHCSTNEKEIFSSVTAVFKRKPNIGTEKYLSLCKTSNVIAECQNDEISVTGSLKGINTMHNLLKVLHCNTSTINGEPNSAGVLYIFEDQSKPSEDKSSTMDHQDDILEQPIKEEDVNVIKGSVSIRCLDCNETFATHEELIEHCKRTHRKHPSPKMLKLSSFKCSFCTRVFQNSKFLNQHVEECHGPNECYICGKEFALKRYLSMHIKRHSDGNKKHSCEICGWKFLERYKLKLHMESHKPKSEKNLPHSCHICKKQFYNKATLDDHVNTHTGNRPFKCDICCCSFAHRIGLKRHLITHEPVKPFKCGVCQKEFSFRAKLDEHFITHTGEGKYVCNSCGKIFTTKSSLKRHSDNCSNKTLSNIISTSGNSADPVTTETNSSEAVFMCGICSLVFDTLEKASVHAASHET
ncbi:zinc finger protein Xfin-like [Mytilus californianus]|uniref:zinc finger protein Xfin-like n=1 Tax=Mytilus californianus TaxID=6549 RepID=UPI002246B30D|nr:zinc finger protein Xfin-like [Mytilus californianus]XP_052081427.1 zinc finger protein Xfin-like [Mytilus californianus]XP_052081428.1 zinc finger protein Xfin-like [Mytilus californianus]